MGEERTQFAYSKATFAAETLKYGVQSITASWASASPRVHSANIHWTATMSKALSRQWGILTIKVRQACLHPVTYCDYGSNDPERVQDTEQPTCANQTRACFLFLPLGLAKGLAGP